MNLTYTNCKVLVNKKHVALSPPIYPDWLIQLNYSINMNRFGIISHER